MATGLLDGEPLTPFPAGIDLATGSEKWRGEKTYRALMDGAGPATVRIAGRRPDGTKTDQLLEVSSGKLRADMPPGLGSVNCVHDQNRTLVCAHAFAVVAVDPATGQLLWVLKEARSARRRR
ncbi:hypothetical protein [Streptomyces sp. NBC_00347]|uniref:hypothetical protein n=1 Tax=Streptomyces sp. NBC_00347 TaxID=2975721 RepID=UPI002251480B|nr:hypothetical protein [Streptomyces sp. NBC_00347]MCX5126870.1 hypothetical protein [Streptomyces sp. NBC_00347]